MFVLDTNTLIYYFKGMGRVAERLLAHSPQEISIPAVVVYDLEVGIAKSTHHHPKTVVGVTIVGTEVETAGRARCRH
ncbi:MAG: hypothetical protein IAE79_23250 [Anaerolinea sp.]|nr:hypothetical protein [Anaerolinea sp.]